MKSTVAFQENYDYTLWPIILLAVLAVAFLIAAILIKSKKNKNSAKKVSHKSTVTGEAKNEALEKIQKVEAEFEAGEVDYREAHLKLSSIVREFVSKVTGIPVESFTLSDLQNFRMDSLKNLICSFYQPEFAKFSQADTKVSINNAKKVVKSWR